MKGSWYPLCVSLSGICVETQHHVQLPLYWFGIQPVSMPEHQQRGQKDANTPAVNAIGEKLLRLLAGISTEELNNPEKATRFIERTVQMIVAYIIVAGLTLFFLSIPSFIDIDGSLHTKNFTGFFWIGSPFVDCLMLLALSLFLAQAKNLSIALGLVGVSGFEVSVYAQYDTMSDFVMLLMCLMVLIHALQILGLLVFGRRGRLV